MIDEEIIHVNLGQRRDRQYLGYGVYATRDNAQVWLSTERDGQVHEVALYPDDIEALNRYVKKVFP